MSRHRTNPGVRKKPAAPKTTMSALVTGKRYDSLIDVTGAVLITVLMVEKLTLGQASDVIGISVNRFRNDGREIAMRFVAKLDPGLGALMAFETLEDEAA